MVNEHFASTAFQDKSDTKREEVSFNNMIKDLKLLLDKKSNILTY